MEKQTWEEFSRRNSWLTSESFIKQCFAVWGRQLLAVLTLYGIILVPVMLIVIIVSAMVGV